MLKEGGANIDHIAFDGYSPYMYLVYEKRDAQAAVLVKQFEAPGTVPSSHFSTAVSRSRRERSTNAVLGDLLTQLDRQLLEVEESKRIDYVVEFKRKNGLSLINKNYLDQTLLSKQLN